MRQHVWQLSRIGKTYHFEAAHQLPKVPDWHKCHRLHGHNYKVEVELRNEIAPNGFCGGVDFFELDEAMRPILNALDHRFLNEVPGLENPTAEHIASWILGKLNEERAMWFSVTVWETPECWATVVNREGWYQEVRRE